MEKSGNQNSFGRKLEQLMIETGVKNATIATALNYDVSYISKWITGKSIPSSKNIEKNLAVISRIMVEEPSDEVIELLMHKFCVQSEGALYEAIADYLLEGYYEVTGGGPEHRLINNAVFTVGPNRKIPLLLDHAADSATDVVVLADLFSLDHVTKLAMAGIQDQTFSIKTRRDDIHIDYIVDLSSLDGNSVFDVILLIHMMTCFSMTEFRLFYHDLAKGKLLIAVKDTCAGISLLGEHRQFLCSTITKDNRMVRDLHDHISSCIDPDQALFFDTDMWNLLLSHEYLQTLLSQNVRWLVGHITEHFISPALFTRLSHTLLTKDVRTDAERAYRLSSSLIQKNQLRLMIYLPAIMNFILSGELDFFNQKVILTPEERQVQLVYFLDLLQHMTPGQLKLIRDGFSEDFKYITNPCIFLSDSIGYLRLENQIYQNNLRVVKNESVKHIFDVFFERIWNYPSNVVISAHEEITHSLEHFVETFDLLVDGI